MFKKELLLLLDTHSTVLLAQDAGTDITNSGKRAKYSLHY
jgi:hypothetical protein